MVHRYQCVRRAADVVVDVPGNDDGSAPQRILMRQPVEKHTFTFCDSRDPAPTFASARCPLHPGSQVTRKGTNNRAGTRFQRYQCTPAAADERHLFKLPLPRVAVVQEENWRDSDVVRNPHRGPTSSGRGRSFTTATVAEGLQRLASGASYASVGTWASAQRPARRADPVKQAARLATLNARRALRGQPPLTQLPSSSKNFWQTGADWVETFSPVLWAEWQRSLESPAPQTLPRVLVLDDIPFFGGPAPDGRARSAMVFSVLVATEYYQASPADSHYNHRVRLVRAYPNHTADAYELLILETGIAPAVIVSDSSTSILSALSRVQRHWPHLEWVPSAFHLTKQLRRSFEAMRWGRPAQRFQPGDLDDRLTNYTFAASPDHWDRWWDDFDARAQAQHVPRAVLPNGWRSKYQARVRQGLEFLEAHPGVPRGNGALEATIRGQVKPFFESRAESFTNIERINRAADLLTWSVPAFLDTVIRLPVG